MPRVSVVITAFNAAPLIGQTLDSVLAQDFKDLELIVVDGGSTDTTVDVVALYGSPVRLIAGGRLTKSAGRNAGLRAAAGEFIAVVDADDCWLPGKLTRQLEHFERCPSCQWVYSDCFICDERLGGIVGKWSDRNELHRGDILGPLLFACFVPSPTPLIRRRVFDEVGLYDESFARHQPEDMDLWLRIAARFPVGVIDEPLAVLRVHPSSLTAREDVRLTGEGVLSVITRAIERNPQLPPQLTRSALSDWHVRIGTGVAGAGRTREARTFFVRAMGTPPFNARAYLLWAGTWLGGPMVRRLRNIKHARK